MFDDLNPYMSLKPIDLLIKQEELNEKLSKAYTLSNADNILYSLLNMKDMLDAEIERRMYSGEINDEVAFIFEDYMHRKNDIENEIMEQIDDVNAQAEFGEINDSELALKLEEIENKKNQAIKRLYESIK